MTKTDQNYRSNDPGDDKGFNTGVAPSREREAASVDLVAVGLGDETACFDAPVGPPVDVPIGPPDDVQFGPRIDVWTFSGQQDASDNAPIPVEEWLAEAVTMTGNIDRENAAKDSSSDVGTKPGTKSRSRMAAMATVAATTNGRRTRSKAGSNGSPRPNGDRSDQGNWPATSGAFTPVAGVGRTLGARNDDSDRGRVVASIIRAPRHEQRFRPGPVAGWMRVVSDRGLLSLMAIVLGLIGLGAGTGFVLARNLPAQWTAEAEVVVDAGTTQPDRFLATQQVLIQSSVVLDQVAAELPIDRKSIEDELTVFPVEASSALGINFVDSDPELARSVVRAVLSAFTAELSEATVDDSAKVYAERLDGLIEQRQMVERRLALLELANVEAEAADLPPPHPAEVRRLALESEQLLNRIVALEEALLVEQIDEMKRTEAVVVTQPRVLPEPTGPNPLALAAVGALVGAVMAVLALFLIAAYGLPTRGDRAAGDFG